MAQLRSRVLPLAVGLAAALSAVGCGSAAPGLGTFQTAGEAGASGAGGLRIFAADTWKPDGLRRAIEAELGVAEDVLSSGTWKPDYTGRSLEAYHRTLGGDKLASYDPNGYLASLGLARPMAAGRHDVNMFQAFKLTTYKPDPRYFPGPPWLVGVLQKALLSGAKISPTLVKGFDKLLTATVVRQMEKVDKLDKDPYGRDEDVVLGTRTDVPLAERYFGFAARRGVQLPWGSGVHLGSPKPENGEAFGTYDIALALGFTEAQARRIAEENNNVDYNATHYMQNGKPRITKSGSGGQNGDYHWHYNRNAAGKEDTRIEAAKLHLDRALRFARSGYCDAAERELGVGLHSLQDIFSHGQVTPINHALLAEFPDFGKFNPVGLFETHVVTEGYLREFATRLALKSPGRLPGAQPELTWVDGDASLLQKGELTVRLEKLPNGLQAFLKAHNVRFVLVKNETPLTSLGFGTDLDGDGRVQVGRWVDRNRDGVKQGWETEGHTAEGRPWNEHQAAYDGLTRRIVLKVAVMRDEAVLRHEIAHALDDVVGQDPSLGPLWRRTTAHLVRLAQRSGAVPFAGADPREVVADRLSRN